MTIGPSENPCFYPPYKSTRALDRDEIHKLVNAVYQASKLIKAAGADGIQIHGHQGYLIDQFTTSLWNHRTDEYGGSLENRLRFPKELIEAIKRGAGADYPVIYRYGLTHYLEGGRTIEEGIEMAKLLESYGVDALDIDSGCYENNYYPHPPSTIPCGSFSYLAKKVKNVVGIPVISSTRIGYPEVAENILESDQADFVSLGRPLIADPYWCEKAKKGDNHNIRPCIACHEGCLRRLMVYKNVSCAVNPQAGDEQYLQLHKTNNKKRVLVIGGGVAGMVAALTLDARGHEVTLCEKDDVLGGNFKLKYLPDFKDDYRRYINYLTHRLDNSNVTVRLNTNVTSSFVNKTSPNFVIMACGASFKRIPVEGLSEERLVNPFSLYEDKDFTNQRVVIIGGGLVGVEAAINVARKGGKPVIIEKMKGLASTAYKVNRDHLELLLNELNIPVFLNANIIKVDGNTIYFNVGVEEMKEEFDVITESVGLKSKTMDIEFDCEILTIGDADHPENVMNAVWQAYRQCRLI